MPTKELILNWVYNNLDLLDTPPAGPSYLLPNGKYIAGKVVQPQFGPNHPGLILQLSLHVGVIDEKTDPFIFAGCLRLNNGVYSTIDSYISLPKEPITDLQYNELNNWLLVNADKLKRLSIGGRNDTKIVLDKVKLRKEMVPEIIKIIKDWYK